jgi:hypothetical protein
LSLKSPEDPDAVTQTLFSRLKTIATLNKPRPIIYISRRIVKITKPPFKPAGMKRLFGGCYRLFFRYMAEIYPFPDAGRNLQKFIKYFA